MTADLSDLCDSCPTFGTQLTSKAASTTVPVVDYSTDTNGRTMSNQSIGANTQTKLFQRFNKNYPNR